MIISVIRNVKSRLEVIYGSHLGSSDRVAASRLHSPFPLGADSSDITIDVPERLAMATLQDLDSTNFFDGGNPDKRTRYDSHKRESD